MNWWLQRYFDLVNKKDKNLYDCYELYLLEYYMFNAKIYKKYGINPNGITRQCLDMEGVFIYD